MPEERMSEATIRQIEASVQDDDLRQLAAGARKLDEARTAAMEAAKALDRIGGTPYRKAQGVAAAAELALKAIAEESARE